MNVTKKRNPLIFTNDNIFSAEQCESIVWMAEKEPFTVIEQGEGRSANLKNLKVSWLKFTIDTAWIFERVMALLRWWEISRLEDIQFSVYSPGGKCDWHIDHNETTHGGAAMDRLCNSIVQLSPPGDYTGGELQFKIQEAVFPGPTAQGSVLVLDKTIWHRVAPLASGERKSLVVWGLK